jgi:hypothetical protein
VSLLDNVLKIQPIAALIPTLGFVVIYGWKSDWRQSAIGRHMMSFMLGFVFVFSFLIFVRFFPQTPGIKWIRFASWDITIFLMTWRFVIIVKVLLARNYEHASEDEK